MIEALAGEAELPALDRALAVLSADPDPDPGAPVPGSHPGLRDYRDDVRNIYSVTALRTVVIWGSSAVIAGQALATV